MKIDAQQQIATESTSRKILVVAGPGSGKTTTLVKRVHYLIGLGVAPEEMVAITFTNAAARELDTRLGSTKLGFIGTLHALCLRTLNLSRTLTVVDEEQAAETMKRSIDRLRSRISVTAAMKGRSDISPAKEIALVLKDYRWQLKASGALDFDMVLVEASEMLAKNGGVVTLAGNKVCRALFVDEYQDSGAIDSLIYHRIKSDYKFFVGDSDQSIYGFRGAQVGNIMKLSEEIPTFYLENNYRSLPAIAKAANALILNNKSRLLKKIKPVLEGEATTKVISCTSDRHEAMEIVSIINKAFAANFAPEEIAVVARTNAIVQNIAKTLAGEGIPVKTKRNLDYPLDWKLAKYAFAAALHPLDDGAIYWYLREAKGKVVADRMSSEAARDQVSLHKIFPTPEISGRDYLTVLAKMGVSIKSIELIQKYEDDLVEPTLSDVLFAVASEYESEEQGKGVIVTTIHGMKGREAEVVIIPGFDQEVIPGNLAKRNLEEERRLAFVAITRAKKWLYLLTSKRREVPFAGIVEMKPSQFIWEMCL